MESAAHNAAKGLHPMSNAEFARFGEFIHHHCGIKMPSSKKTMLQSRLQKRLRALRIATYSDYADFLFSPRGTEEELLHMIDAVTTNKTDFFREAGHFNFLKHQVLQTDWSDGVPHSRLPMKIWSAGCSTGEEPWTLAMILAEHESRFPRFRFSILATDISTKVLAAAREGLYGEDKITPVPMELRRKYLLKSKTRPLVKIVPELRSRVEFARLNFMDESYPVTETMDVIFCRNVLIYFERHLQETIVARLCRHLAPGGWLFVGHSESLGGMDLPLRMAASAVYRKGHE